MNPNIIASAVLSIGLTAAAWTLGSQFHQLRESGVITVKGLAEAPYKASTGTWRIGVETWAKDYAGALAANETQLAKVKDFLAQQGFKDDEIQLDAISVDSHRETYTDENGREQTRKNGYDATRYYTLSTPNLATLEKAVQNVQNLRAENESVVFSNPQYYLADLENIKRTLISKATQDAHIRAEEFAKTGNMKVGAMQSASQGSFDIQAANSSEDSSDYGGGYDPSTIDKNVRLVVTIQYRID